MNLSQELNEQQEQAVTHTEGAMLVVAGPGTGKTKVITHRIAHLIRSQHVPPNSILAVTFTNKAAQEMLERVKELLGTTQGLDVRIHTFHAFCVGLLREHASEIGLSENFTIFDQETQEEVLVECLRDLRLNERDYPLWQLRNIIGAHKIKLEDPLPQANDVEAFQAIRTTDKAAIDDSVMMYNITELVKAYQSKLADYNALDFDDLISKSVEVLKAVPSVRAKYHNDIQYILVDEYQDINASQYTLLKCLCRSPQRNLMVVADEDQSIYSWRGSDPQYIEEFKSDFEPVVVELEEHYRCSEKILRAAQAVIARNTRQKESLLKTHQDTGNIIYHYNFDRPEAEARNIVKLIRQLVDQRNYSYGNIAVFYRKHELAEILADRLYREDLKFQRIGKTNSFQEDHAKDVVSYLSFIQWELRPHDLERTINFPQQLIDDLTLVRLKWLAQRNDISLVALLRKIEAYPDDVGPLTRRNIQQLFQQIDQFAAEIEGENTSRIAVKLYELLERRRSPYRDEEIHEIENQLDIPLLQTAADTLSSGITRGDSIQIVATYGIDSYCAAHIIHQTLEKYLECNVALQLLPSGLSESDSVQSLDRSHSGITVWVGDFGVMPETETTILIGVRNNGLAEDNDGTLLQLTHAKTALADTQSKSLIALKLCQRLLGYFERPNFADMVVYDLETLDTDPEHTEIVEIAARRLSKIGSRLERYYQLVKPPRSIPKSSTHIHGIDNETVQDEPSIEAVLPKFLGFIQDRILIGHNIAEFDNLILDRDLEKYLGTGLSNSYYDTLVTARRLYPRENCRLEALAEKFGIEHGAMHRALEDVDVTHQVFEKLIRADLSRREVRSLTEFLPLVGIGLLDVCSNSGSEPIPSELLELNTEPPVAGQIAETSGEPSISVEQAFVQAAARHIQCHPFEFDELLGGLQPAEAEQTQSFIQSLQSAKLAKFLEDLEWEERRAKFMNGVLHFETHSNEKELADFLRYQKLISNADEVEIENDKLTLMTVHAAKGTEFLVVIIMGMEENTFPIWQKDATPEDIEEERRLFYVGMTRAQEQLYLTSVTYRQSDWERAPSMFIREIPSNLIKRWPPR
jgi:DNA polymerase III epsilon subunit family exonuclease